MDGQNTGASQRRTQHRRIEHAGHFQVINILTCSQHFLSRVHPGHSFSDTSAGFCGNSHRPSENTSSHHDRFFNLDITGAAADIAAQSFFNSGGRWLRVLVQQCLCTDYHPWCAKTALHGSGFGKCPSISLFFLFSQPFHRNDRLPLNPANQLQAGPHRQAINQYHTRAAGTFGTAIF